MPESRVIVTTEEGVGESEALFPASSVLVSSAGAGWQGIDAERLQLAMETPEHHHEGHFLTLQLGPPALMEWQQGGRHQQARALPGEFTLIGAGVPHAVRYENADVLAISLAPDLVLRVARDILKGSAADRVEFIPQNGTHDRQVERIGSLLKAEMEVGCPSGRLFAEGLGQALAAHLVAHYTAVPQTTVAAAEPTRLSPAQLRRALDFIEENLARDLPLAEIAQAVGLSPYHFARQFKATVGVAPHTFLIERRVERAKQLLTRTDLPIAQIASAVGFAHQSHLTRHFRRLTGTTPARFR